MDTRTFKVPDLCQLFGNDLKNVVKHNLCDALSQTYIMLWNRSQRDDAFRRLVASELGEDYVGISQIKRFVLEEYRKATAACIGQHAVGFDARLGVFVYDTEVYIVVYQNIPGVHFSHATTKIWDFMETHKGFVAAPDIVIGDMRIVEWFSLKNFWELESVVLWTTDEINRIVEWERKQEQLKPPKTVAGCANGA